MTAVDPLHDSCPPSAGARRTNVDDSSTTIVYANNFDGNERLHDQVLATLSGGIRCPVERFAGLGHTGCAMEGQMLRASSVETFRVQLSNLPPHESLDLNFLLAVIDSWDGTQEEAGEFDALEVRSGRRGGIPRMLLQQARSARPILYARQQMPHDHNLP